MKQTHTLRNLGIILLALMIGLVASYFCIPQFKEMIRKQLGNNTVNSIDNAADELGSDAEQIYISALPYGKAINSGNVRRVTENKLDLFYKALVEKDTASIKGLLSEKAKKIAGADAMLVEITEFIQGKVVSTTCKTNIEYSVTGEETDPDARIRITSGEEFFIFTDKERYYCRVEFTCRNDSGTDSSLGLNRIIFGTLAAACSDEDALPECCIELDKTKSDGYDVVCGKVYQISSGDTQVSYERAVKNFKGSTEKSWDVFSTLLGTPYISTYWEKIYRISEDKGKYLRIELSKEYLTTGEPDTVYRMTVVSDREILETLLEN